MKVLAAVTLTLLLGVVYTKEYKVKSKNQMFQKLEDDVIDVDETKGTETIKTDGQTSIKDFNTGYGAIKSEEKKECFIFKIQDTKEQTSVVDLEKDLDAIQHSGKQPVAREMSVKSMRGEAKLTDGQRADIGPNVLAFCDGLTVILGHTGGDEEEEGEDSGDMQNHVLNRRKRQTTQSCSYQLYYVPYCVYYYVYYCYYTYSYYLVCPSTTG